MKCKQFHFLLQTSSVRKESLGKHQLNWTLIKPLRLSLKENQKDSCLCSLTNCTRIWSICMKTTFTLPQPTYNLWQNRRSDILSLLTTQSALAKILLEWNIYCATCTTTRQLVLISSSCPFLSVSYEMSASQHSVLILLLLPFSYTGQQTCDDGIIR